MRRTGRPLTAAAFVIAFAGLAAGPADATQGGLDVRPATSTPGSTVTVTTTACGAHGSAAGETGTVGAGRFTLTPYAGGPGALGRFAVPGSAQPGTYEITARCLDGTEVTGDLIVSPAAAAGAPGPAGTAVQAGQQVKTGVGGGTLGSDPVRTAAGVAALAVAAAGGTWLLHRRARGDGI
ncbi:hypothetical protein [Streptomyces beihaiensis]|uniref:Carboxypeptidase regulatory-like domain-containing protein n=1 Tax=Streptomyces beihaiensis TaxID=2984495 RepID=A0ABT3TNN5_9ACTN|nr:hypothetical protein [Streptomyces beihaiensis]MCX3058649.1 hypothetical protein [Streptomyces beihaiensis]